MQRTPLTPPVGFSAQTRSSTLLNVVIAYEDFETGKSAKRVYDVLLEYLGSECELSSLMWKFDVLRIPKLLDMAMRDAETADILVVSCRGQDELPPAVKRWLETGLAEHPIALVGLFDSLGGYSHPVREYLAAAARRAGVEFFARPDESAGIPDLYDAGALQQIPRIDMKTWSMLSGMMQQDWLPRRGIDE